MKNIKFSKYRNLTAIAAIIIIVGAAAADKGLGTFCSVCPLGFLEVSAASRHIPWHMLWGVLAAAVIIYIFGRIFCAWLCPSSLIQRVFHREPEACAIKTQAPWKAYVPYGVLAGSLVLSFLLKFPVFCVICPIGLFFGFLFALLRLFHLSDPGLNLLIFPAVIGVELLFFRRWCSGICPVSAIFSILSKLPGVKMRLSVAKDTCILAGGGRCGICKDNCPEGLDITSGGERFSERCSSCLKCKDNCPTGSIAFRAFLKRIRLRRTDGQEKEIL